ncbi:hypothetical protein BKA93DRAFT_22312 [Sparassis latifolia]
MLSNLCSMTHYIVCSAEQFDRQHFLSSRIIQQIFGARAANSVAQRVGTIMMEEHCSDETFSWASSERVRPFCCRYTSRSKNKAGRGLGYYPIYICVDRRTVRPTWAVVIRSQDSDGLAKLMTPRQKFACSHYAFPSYTTCRHTMKLRLEMPDEVDYYTSRLQ